MSTPTEVHTITTDEQTGPDYAAKAFCSCGWAGWWRHADQMPGWHPEQGDDHHEAQAEAMDEAETDGREHLSFATEDEED